jgi:predicted ester cyclase
VETTVTSDENATPAERGVALANQFLTRVWGPTHDLDAIDELMTEDYRIWSGGKLVAGRPAFKDWVRHFQTLYGNAHTEIRETFANAAGDRVVSRWFNTGVNHGIFGLAPDGRPVSFTGIAIWRVHDGRLAECWVERAALESYQSLTR